jgi:RNA polymerase sigma-70 factor (ECF subfamily)
MQDRGDTAVRSAQERFQELLARHRGIAFKVANAYCWNPEDQRDLVQEIYAQVWRAFPRYDPHRSFSTWMYRIALNVAISYRRSLASRDRHLSPVEGTTLEAIADTRSAEADERVRELYRVIDRLDDLNRALVLLYLDGHHYADIAEVLGITETNVATKLNRLKQRLRREMTDAGRPGAVS